LGNYSKKGQGKSLGPIREKKKKRGDYGTEGMEKKTNNAGRSKEKQAWTEQYFLETTRTTHPLGWALRQTVVIQTHWRESRGKISSPTREEGGVEGQ